MAKSSKPVQEFTVRVNVEFDGQLPVVPVIVYMVVAAGVATTTLPIAPLNEPDGLHEYDVAPDAFKTLISPAHIKNDVVVTLTVG